MKGNTIEELYDIIARTGEATFLYRGEEYQILTDMDEKDKTKTIYSIWKVEERKNPKPLIEYVFDTKNEHDIKYVQEFLSKKGFDGDKSFIDVEKNIEITYHG